VRQRVYRSDVINTCEQKRSLFFQDKKEEEEEKVDSSLGRILKLNKPETIYIIWVVSAVSSMEELCLDLPSFSLRF